jgi:S1-C subfamily serine protease
MRDHDSSGNAARQALQDSVFETPHRQSEAGVPEQDLLGIGVAELNRTQRRQLGSPSGLLVVKVDAQSRGRDAGLRKGDVIEQVNRRPVSSKSELRKALSKYQDETLLLLVRRNNYVTRPVIGAASLDECSQEDGRD